MIRRVTPMLLFSLTMVQAQILPKISGGKELTIRESFNILFKSEETIHATPHVTNLIRNGASELTDGEKQALKVYDLYEVDENIIALTPNDLDQFYTTEHFRLYYTLDDSSSDAVMNVEYVINMGEVFEEVWTYYMDTLGFEPPPFDPWADLYLYNIYIENLPAYYRGVTYATDANVEDPACASYIKMRNSYSTAAFCCDLTELENIKLAAVHEFFHAIQFGYNCYERIWIMEATAVWSEDELYDEINDHYRYMPSWFENPDKAIDDESSHMYGSFIYFQYIDEHLGGAETIRRIWENSNENNTSFSAIDLALESQNSNFVYALNHMTIANRILSSSTGAGIYSYEEANGYLTVVSQPSIYGYLSFSHGDTLSGISNNLSLYGSQYWTISTDVAVNVELNNNLGPPDIYLNEDSTKWTHGESNYTHHVNPTSVYPADFELQFEGNIGDSITIDAYDTRSPFRVKNVTHNDYPPFRISDYDRDDEWDPDEPIMIRPYEGQTSPLITIRFYQDSLDITETVILDTLITGTDTVYTDTTIFDTTYLEVIHPVAGDIFRVQCLNYPMTSSIINAVAKLSGQNEWSIQSGRSINLYPQMGFDWISIVVVAQNIEADYLDYELILTDSALTVQEITVYSGDTDNNGVVDAYDVLPIGIYFHNAGVPHNSISYVWEPRTVYPFSNLPATYADANGDGTIDEEDVIGIGVNWGNSHVNGSAMYTVNLNDSLLIDEHRKSFRQIYNSLSGESQSTAAMRSLLGELLGDVVPLEFALRQNYPNPFNSGTTISFSLPEPSEVSLVIYNLLGQVASKPIENKPYQAGSHDFKLVDTDMVSGLYFFQITAGSNQSTKKMILLK